MHPMTHLDDLRRQMVEQLTQIPEYRALKAMERFIAEMSSIYDAVPEAEEDERESAQEKIAQAIENHVRGDAGPAIVKNAAYVPVQRVA